jgi:hypothetical protein
MRDTEELAFHGELPFIDAVPLHEAFEVVGSLWEAALNQKPRS